MNSRFRYLLVLPPAVALALLLVAGWPGGVSVDTSVSINEGRTFQFWGHQEPMCGLLWAGLQAVMKVHTAVAVCFVLQVTLYWIAFLLLAREALRAGSIVTAVLAVLGGFLPPLVCFTVNLESNVLCGIAWLGALSVAASVRSRLGLVACGLLLWLGFVVRSGMIVPLVPVAFACAALARPQWSKWRSLGLAIGIGIAFQGVSFAVTKTLLGAPTRDSVLSISQVFDMAAVYHETKVHHVPTFLMADGHQGHAAEEVFAHYRQDSVVGMFWRRDGKPVFRPVRNPEEGAQLRAAWLQTIREFPGAYLVTKLRYARLFLGIGVEWAAGFWPDFDANERLELFKPKVPETLFGVYASWTATSLLWKAWFWALLAGVVVLAGAMRRAARTAPAVALYLGGIGGFVPQFLFGQAVLCRYYFLPFSLFVASILLVLPGLLQHRGLGRSGGAGDASPGTKQPPELAGS
jgi:hypothetical protein